jgi:pilus assembly protein CpaE
MSNKITRVLLVEDNAVSARLAEAMLSHTEAQDFEVRHADSLLAALDLLVHHVFDVAVVDLNLPDSQGLDTFLTIQRFAPALPVIVLTGLDDESMALSAMRQGAQDYLVKGKLNREMFVRVLNYALVRNKKPDTGTHVPETATVVGLLGSKGGVGTTTLACHWALELHRQTGKKVLLLELDVCSTGASFLLKPDSKYTLLDAAQNLHRLDAHLWSGIVCSPRDGLDLLRAPGAAGLSDAPTAERIRQVLRFARTRYDWIVVDLGRLTASSQAIMEEINDVFVIATPDLPALYETTRLVKRLLEGGFTPQKLHALLNRKEKAMSISVDQFEKAIGYPLYGSIGDHSEEINGAYVKGRFLDENLQLRKQMAPIMQKWLGIEQAPVRAGLWFLRSARTV